MSQLSMYRYISAVQKTYFLFPAVTPAIKKNEKTTVIVPIPNIIFCYI